MIIDPWGSILAQVADGTGLAVAELDLSRLDKVRTAIPVLNHRREKLSKFTLAGEEKKSNL
jgi:predicted amidohydrolase